MYYGILRKWGLLRCNISNDNHIFSLPFNTLIDMELLSIYYKGPNGPKRTARENMDKIRDIATEFLKKVDAERFDNIT